MIYRRALAVFGALAALTSASIAGQAPRTTGSAGAAPSAARTPARTAWGDPDLQGIWRVAAPVPFERPDEYAGREFLSDDEVAAQLTKARDSQAERLSGKATNRAFRAQENYNSVFSQSDDAPRVSKRTSAIIDPANGLLPSWTLEQVKRWEEREALTKGRGEAQSLHDINTGARCITDMNAAKVGAWGLGFGPHKATISDADALGREDSPGGPRFDDEPKRIVQTPGWVAFLGEEAGDYLYIPLDGRRAPGPNIRQWSGVPRGHWEGNTLVVEITNLQFDYPIIPNGGFQAYPGDGKTLRVTKRFTRTAPDAIDYTFTIVDPAVYTQPYTVLHELYRDDNYKIAPDMCQEANSRNMGNVLANARADEATAIENGLTSARIRKARFEEIKRAAQAAAVTQPTTTR